MRDTVLLLSRVLAPALGLRQPRFPGVIEPVSGCVRYPRQGDPATITASLGALSSEECGVLAHLGRERGVFWKPELFALIHVRRSGQREHEKRCRAGSLEPQALIRLNIIGRNSLGQRSRNRKPETRCVTYDIVVGQNPGRGSPYCPERIKRFGYDIAQVLRVPLRG